MIEDFSSDDLIRVKDGLGVTDGQNVLDLADQIGDNALIRFGGSNSLRREDVSLAGLAARDFEVF